MVVRLRPLTASEAAGGRGWDHSDCSIWQPARVRLPTVPVERPMSFDRVFGENEGNVQIYEALAKGRVERVLQVRMEPVFGSRDNGKKVRIQRCEGRGTWMESARDGKGAPKKRRAWRISRSLMLWAGARHHHTLDNDRPRFIPEGRGAARW